MLVTTIQFSRKWTIPFSIYTILTYLVTNNKIMRLKKSFRISGLLLAVLVTGICGCTGEERVLKLRAGTSVSREGVEAPILKFSEDSAGRVWMMTGSLGLYRAEGQTLLHFTADSLNAGSLLTNLVNDIETAPDGSFWIGLNGGVDRFDGQTETFHHYDLDTYDTNIRDIFFDPDGEVYAASWRTIFKLDTGSHAFKTYLDFRSITHEQIHPIFDGQGQLWVWYGTRLTGFDAVLQHRLDINLPQPFRSVLPFRDEALLYLDADGSLHSIAVVPERTDELPDILRPLSGKNIRSMEEKGENHLCFITDQGMALYDARQDQFFTPWKGTEPLDPVLSSLNESIFLIDRNSNLWSAEPDGSYRVNRLGARISSPHSRLLFFLQGKARRAIATNDRFAWMILNDNTLLTYDTKNQDITDVSDLEGLTGLSTPFSQILCGFDNRLLLSGFGNSSTDVVSLTTDRNGVPSMECRYTAPEPIAAGFDAKGEVWAFGIGSQFFHGPKPQAGQQEIQLSRVEGLPLVNEISFATKILPLRDGRILFGPTNNNPVLLDPSGPSLMEIPIRDGHYRVLWTNFLEDSQGDLWIGSGASGLSLYRLSDEEDNQVHPLSSVPIRNIREDPNRNILFMGMDGKLSLWNRRTGDIELIWNNSQSESSTAQLLTLPDGSVFIVNTTGVIPFYLPEETDSPFPEKSVVVTFLSDDSVIESFHLSGADGDTRIKLLLKQLPEYPNMVLSTDGSGMGYSFDYQVKVNRTGKYVAKGKSSLLEIPLNSLRYGRNRIRFHIRHSGGTGSEQAYCLILKVRHPFWHWLVMAAALVILFLMLRLIHLLYKKNEESCKARQEKEMQERVNLRNIDFFANISHEFRSPLTLINGALSSIRETESPEDRERFIRLARRNVSRMLNLTSQLMDFNKLGHKELTLNVSRCDLTAIFQNIWESFSVGAHQKNIDFHLHGCEEPHEGWADEDKLEKILWNLCSNALKFTPPGGVVDLDVSFRDDQMTAKVLDTGIGLDEDLIPHLFERFSQGDNAKQVGGTGIGLYYTKSLVQLHHGDIQAANRTDGPGSTFQFSIPIGEASYSETEKASLPDPQTTELSGRVVSFDMGEVETPQDNQDSPSVLVIDDDYELVYYLRDLLSKYYRVSFRFDAMSGYNVIREEAPDVVICDIMMMDVSGLELCKMIKGNLDTCHIPVIMLTARSSVSDQVCAFDIGADAYVVKPFDPGYLQALVRSMIENRRRLKQSLSLSTETPDHQESDGLSSRDRQFMDKVYACLEESMGAGEIDIDRIASDIGVSRSKFFYKIKGLTGQTPGEFFTSYRLNRAAQLLREDKYKISAVAAMVGFNSSSHFASLFRKHFGVLPSDYLNNA